MNNLGRFSVPGKNRKRTHAKSIRPVGGEQEFFSSLIGGDVGALGRILGDDFLLIDVMTGSEVKSRTCSR